MKSTLCLLTLSPYIQELLLCLQASRLCLHTCCQPALFSDRLWAAAHGSTPAKDITGVLQLSYISQREGGGPRAVEAAEAAHGVLMALGTDASHGMLPEVNGKEGNELNEHLAAEQHKAPTVAGETHQARLQD